MNQSIWNTSIVTVSSAEYMIVFFLWQYYFVSQFSPPQQYNNTNSLFSFNQLEEVVSELDARNKFFVKFFYFSRDITFDSTTLKKKRFQNWNEIKSVWRLILLNILLIVSIVPIVTLKQKMRFFIEFHYYIRYNK